MITSSKKEILEDISEILSLEQFEALVLMNSEFIRPKKNSAPAVIIPNFHEVVGDYGILRLSIGKDGVRSIHYQNIDDKIFTFKYTHRYNKCRNQKQFFGNTKVFLGEFFLGKFNVHLDGKPFNARRLVIQL